MLDQVLFKLTFSSALLSTEVTLKLCDSCVDRLVLVEVALVGELLAAVLTGKREHSLVDKLLVFFDVFSVLGDLTADITSKGGKVHRLVSHVEAVSVELVFLQVTFSYTLITDITERVLRGRR